MKGFIIEVQMKPKAIGVESSNRTPMAYCFYGDGSSAVERGFCKPLVESSNPSHRPSFSALLAALTARRAYLGLAPKAGLVPAVILTPLPEESKGQNDLPSVPHRMPKVREA